MQPAPDTASTIFEARLFAQRSLAPAGFRILLAIYVALSCALGLPFILMGAWPVAGFLGLDGLLLYFAFRANYRAARAYELVSVSFTALQIAKVTAAGQRRDWRFHPWWTKLAREEDEEFGLRKLFVQCRETSVEIATYLSPDERESFAAAVSKAMAQARQGARYS